MTASDLQLLLEEALVGAELESFSFGTGFTLHFARAVARGLSWPPRQVTVRIEGVCEVVAEGETWEGLLSEFPVRTTEPDEPLTAALLVRLRWEGGPVAAVRLVEDEVVLRFGNGSTLRARAASDGESLAWLVGPTNPGDDWFVRSEFGEVTARRSAGVPPGPSYVAAQDDVRSRHGIAPSGAGLLEAWSSFVDECAEGYSWDVSEYWNEVRVRDRIELLLTDGSLQPHPEHAEFVAAVVAIDSRFRGLAHPQLRFRRSGEWWHQLFPSTSGAEFEESARSSLVESTGS